MAAAEGYDGTLSVRVVRGTGLLAQDRGGVSDPYVLVRAGNHNFKSGVVKATVDPEWEGEDGSGSIGPFSGATVVEVIVMDWDRFGGNDAMGKGTVDFAELAGEEPWSGTIALELPEGYDGDAENGGSLELELQFTKTIVPEDEIPFVLPVLEPGETAPRAAGDEGKLFHGKFLLKAQQLILSSVNLPFLNHEQEKTLVRTMLERAGDFMPMTALKYVASVVQDFIPDNIVKTVFTEGLKADIAGSMNKIIDIPFVGEETERKMIATAYICCKSQIRQSMALFSWLIDSMKAVYQFRLGQGVPDPDEASVLALLG